MATSKVSLRSKTARGKTVFYLDYRVNGKRFRPKVGPNKRDAELIRAKIEREILLGTYQVSVSKKAIGLGGLIDEFLDARKHSIRESSLHRYRNYFDPLRSYFEKSFPAVTADVSLIETKYLRKFIDDAVEGRAMAGKKWSRRTGNDAIKIYRSLFKFAIDEGYLTKNPAAKVDPMRVPSTGKADFFTDDELEPVWKIIDPHWVDPLKFILNTGLRKAELINLRWSAVNLTSGQEQITVESCDDWETKTGNSRMIPLNEEAIEIVGRQMGKNPEFVFTSPTGKTIHPDKIYHAFKTALAKCNVEGDVHKLRHSFASNLTMKGVDLASVAQLLGHTDVKTTQIYTHLSPSHIREAVGKLGDDPDAEAA